MSASPVQGSPVSLSRRELEIAGLVAQGLTNREIAARLFISERTVDGHLEHVREKLSVNTRAQVAAWVVSQSAATATAEVAASPALPVSQRITAAAAPAGAPVGPRAQRWTRIEGRRLWVVIAVLLAVAASGVVTLLIQPKNATMGSGPTIQTIAGSKDVGNGFPGGGYSGDGFAAINAQLSRPSDVTPGPSGTVYIADQFKLVREISSTGNITTVAGMKNDNAPPPTNGADARSVGFGYLSNVAVDKGGRLFLLTNLDAILQVWMVDTNSLITHVVSLGPSSGGGQGYWHMPVGGLAVASDGTLYIAERAGNKVWELAAGAKVATLYAGTGDAFFSGDLSAASSARLDSPLGLALDLEQNLYIADAGNNRIRRVDHQTKIITTVAGSGKYYGDGGDGGPATEARLDTPFGVAVRTDGTIFIADTGNNRLRVVSASGRISALAGTAQSGFLGDGGLARDARLSGPEAVALDNGNLLVADTENQRIREVRGPLA